MAYGYWKSGMKDTEAVFHLFFRKHPFKGGFTIACGLARAIDLMKRFSFTKEDIAYLSTLTGNNGKPLFDHEFLQYLAQMKFECSVAAIPEGNIVFPHQPLIRLRGPIIQCQILETTLLNLINFETLIATKAARICLAAKGEAVLEFGLRRAQGIDGGLSASRAAYVGGCAATSNVLAGKHFGIPIKGTHAHSWVMSFPSEEQAFHAYAKAMPNNCVFLVDTYDTIEGVKEAIKQAIWLRERGFEMVGIRLDSGDLAQLSIEARKLLDQAGFPNAAIVASDSLDEYKITKIKERGGTINVWGVGTRLATAYDQPALGGVYKVAALRDNPNEPWQYKVKLSENIIKVSNPGIQQVRRFFNEEGWVADMIYNQAEPTDNTHIALSDTEQIDCSNLSYKELLVPIFEQGKLVYEIPSVHESRNLTIAQLASFPHTYKHLTAPKQYPTGLEANLYTYKKALVKKLSKKS